MDPQQPHAQLRLVPGRHGIVAQRPARVVAKPVHQPPHPLVQRRAALQARPLGIQKRQHPHVPARAAQPHRDLVGDVPAKRDARDRHRPGRAELLDLAQVQIGEVGHLGRRLGGQQPDGQPPDRVPGPQRLRERAVIVGVRPQHVQRQQRDSVAMRLDRHQPLVRCRVARLQDAGQRRRRRLVVDRGQGGAAAEQARQPLGQFDRQQRVAALIEERLVGMERLLLQQVAHDPRHRLDRRIGRAGGNLGRASPGGGQLAQRGGVELAAFVARHVGQQHDARRHRRRQFGAQDRADRLFVGGARDPGHQHVGVSGHMRLGHAGQARQRRLDPRGLDPVAAQLQLPVDAVEIDEFAPARLLHPVPGAEPALSVGPVDRARQRAEPLGRLVGPLEIAKPHPRPADPQLPRPPLRRGRPVGGQHRKPRGAKRAADRHAVPVERFAPVHVDGGGRGRLGRAVAVHEGDVRRDLPPFLKAGRGHPFAAHDHQPQVGRQLAVRDVQVRGQQPPERGRDVQDRDPLRVKFVHEAVERVEHLVAAQHDRGPGAQRGQDFLDRHVEAEGGKGQHPVARGQAEGVGGGAGVVVQRAAPDHDRLGRPGAARGEDEIGRIVVAGRGQRVQVHPRRGRVLDHGGRHRVVEQGGVGGRGDQDERGRGLVDHARAAFGREVGFKLQERGPGPQHRDPGRDGGVAARQRHAHDRAGADPVGQQRAHDARDASFKGGARQAFAAGHVHAAAGQGRAPPGQVGGHRAVDRRERGRGEGRQTSVGARVEVAQDGRGEGSQRMARPPVEPGRVTAKAQRKRGQVSRLGRPDLDQARCGHRHVGQLRRDPAGGHVGRDPRRQRVDGVARAQLDRNLGLAQPPRTGDDRRDDRVHPCAGCGVTGTGFNQFASRRS